MSADANTTSKPANTIPIRVEFTGGLELIFSSTRKVTVDLSVATSTSNSTATTASSQPTIADLINHLLVHPLLDQSRKDLFVLDGTVRPGILVLINDADWALEGEGECVLSGGDEVVFVSTLHGG